MGPMSKEFCWKSNPFGRHIPVCLNMWVPPPGLTPHFKGILLDLPTKQILIIFDDALIFVKESVVWNFTKAKKTT